MTLVGRDPEQLTPFEALHLARAGLAALDQQPDAILDSGLRKLFAANGRFLEEHPEALVEVQALVQLSQDFMRPYGT